MYWRKIRVRCFYYYNKNEKLKIKLLESNFKSLLCTYLSTIKYITFDKILTICLLLLYRVYSITVPKSITDIICRKYVQ